MSTTANGFNLTKSLISRVTEESLATSSLVTLVEKPASCLPLIAEAVTTTSSIVSNITLTFLVSPTVSLKPLIVSLPLADEKFTVYGPPGLRPLAINLPSESVDFLTTELVGW